MSVVTPISAVAARFNVTEATVRSWVLRNQLAPVQRGTKPLMFWTHDVERFAASRMSEADHQRLDALWAELLDETPRVVQR